MLNQIYSKPWGGGFYYFISINERHLIDALGGGSKVNSRALYFKDREEYETTLTLVEESSESGEGKGYNTGCGINLSGSRTIIDLTFNHKGQLCFTSYDGGYEASEFDLIDLFEIGEEASQERRKLAIESYGYIFKGGKIDLVGYSFRYRQ